MQTYKCKVSKIDEELNIIVLYPERSKYLRWKLPTVAHLIQQNLKINNSFDIFQLDCASEIREAHQFILEKTEVEIRKATAAIWKSAEEGVITEYHKLNMEYKKAYEERNGNLIYDMTLDMIVLEKLNDVNDDAADGTVKSEKKNYYRLKTSMMLRPIIRPINSPLLRMTKKFLIKRPLEFPPPLLDSFAMPGTVDTIDNTKSQNHFQQDNEPNIYGSVYINPYNFCREVRLAEYDYEQVIRKPSNVEAPLKFDDDIQYFYFSKSNDLIYGIKTKMDFKLADFGLSRNRKINHGHPICYTLHGLYRQQESQNYHQGAIEYIFLKGLTCQDNTITKRKKKTLKNWNSEKFE